MDDKHLDQIIKASLSAEEAAYYDRLDEQQLVDKVFTLYKGKQSWISLVQTLVMIWTFIAAVYCIVQFYKSSDVAMMLRAGFAAILLLITGCMIKIYLNNLIVEKAIRRDVKRVELQLTHIAHCFDSAQQPGDA